MSCEFCHVRHRGAGRICDICILTVKSLDGMIKPEFIDTIICKRIIIKLAGDRIFHQNYRKILSLFSIKDS